MGGRDAILNMATINELSAMLDEGVDELFDEYLRNGTVLLRQLAAAAEQDDMGALRYLAHSLKGSSGNLGISQVYRLCLVLEQDAEESPQMLAAADRVAEIAQAFTHAAEALQALRAH